MPEHSLFHLLLRDLQACLGILLFAIVFVTTVAVPMAFSDEHLKQLPWVPSWALRIWFVGVIHTAGWWIVLTAIFHLLWLALGAGKLLLLPLFLGYLFSFVVSIRQMVRTTHQPPEDVPKTFSLKSLLITQFVILALCGLWLITRRAELGI